MGKVIDEDSGDAVLCPYCGQDGECPHLLAIIDRSFLEVQSGKAMGRVSKALKAIELAFKKRLAISMEARRQPSWNDEHFHQLWEAALEAWNDSDGDQVVSIDMDVFYDLFADLLDEAGGHRYPGRIIEDGGPGFTSLLVVLHARYPTRVLKAFDKILSRRIETKSNPSS